MISAVSAVVEEVYRNVIVDGRGMVMVLVVSTESVAPAVIGLRAATKRESGRNGEMGKWEKGSGGKPRGDSATTAGASATRNTFRRANGLCPRLCYSRHKLSILELIYSFNLPT